MDEKIIKDKLLKNFLEYTSISSQSNEDNREIPTSKGQLILAKKLATELEELGAKNIRINQYGVLQAVIEARGACDISKAKIGWVCHLDTVDVGLSPNINPKIIKSYDGGDIILDPKESIVIRPSEEKSLEKYIGDDLIVTDGKSVLGADNKAAIANVMTAIWYLRENPSIDHGKIYIAFVPDEEIGLRGVRKIDFDNFDVDFAYTIDCCEIGELVYETFNAASGYLKIKGRSAHPMSGKNKLVNPIMIAHDFVSMLDRSKMPEHTEKREGYVWVTDINSDTLNCKVKFNIRDHDKEKFLEKKSYLMKITDLLKERYEKADIGIKIEDTYANIKDSINEDNYIAIEKLKKAFEKHAIKAKIIAMRGGTDGSYLSTRDILTPNYFTGACNFHSNKEFMPMNSFYKSFLVTLELMIS
ncbi:peptidase T [Anaerococcus marasmi]|uniref:peptidase T n=1 Tax=Anaerococcus marasmi TaxID=2057797 RepID=UPI000CF8ACB3|nr:peptidase T [Anaerococcus marasmi]